jgi:hypothetical protein
LLPPDVKLFAEHAIKLDGTSNEPTVIIHALTSGSGGFPERLVR